MNEMEKVENYHATHLNSDATQINSPTHDVDIEKGQFSGSHGTSGSTTPQVAHSATEQNEKENDSDSASSSSQTEDDIGFAPISTHQTQPPHQTRPMSRQSHNTTFSHISRSRSNNGFGVDDLEDEAEKEEEGADAEAAAARSGAGETIKDEEEKRFEVGWEGGDSDPLNPRSMPTWRKWIIIAVLSIGSFAVTHASAIYTATYTQMNAEFHCSRIVATLGLSFFVLGIAMGPFWSPLAEFYGRRPIYICSFAGFLIWLIPSAVAKNIQTMIIARFFQGLAGSAFLSVSGGTVGDLFTREKFQLPMAIFALSPFIGPATGPLVGGLINTFTTWRWTYYFLIIWAGVLLACVVVLVPETYHPVLLKRKAVNLRKTTGDNRYHAPIERTTKSVASTLGNSLLRPFQLLLLEPMCLILDVYSAVLLGVLYLFFGAFPLVFRTNHGFNLWQVGLTFMGLGVSMVLAGCITPVWTRVRNGLAEKRFKKTGIMKGEPEDQLPPVIVGAPLITGGLFMFGFSTYPWVHWIVPIIGSSIFGLGMSFAFTGIFTFLVDAYPRYAASALATNALVRCSFAAAFPLFGIQMYEKLGYQWATALLAFLTLGMMPFPYLFFVFGKRIRARSKFATRS
ncbi:major facilitator superfamily domain-containing protein [Neurospora intermedia]|uniref:Major facilitator superfamily domain-containing protein n=1 Tax=Neurospora intermedia TaxID=5142 RepID=A0ABR3DB82_NEUIN